MTKNIDNFRNEIHLINQVALEARASSRGLIADETELRLGVFYEQLEPQVIEALLIINQKGYPTRWSGFDCQSPDKQVVEGDFVLGGEVREKLMANGARVMSEDGVTRIEFDCEETSLIKLREKWYIVAQILPDLGVGPATCWTGENFRAIYGKPML